MLNDSDRKVFRIIYNYFSLRRNMPDWNNLMRNTGKTKEGLIDVLASLEKQHYLKWNGSDLETLLMIQQPDKVKNNNTSNLDYFTEH